MLIVILFLAVAIILLLGAIIFVSIVWTHRPDLSVGDIFVEAFREVFHYSIICSRHRAGREEKNQ